MSKVALQKILDHPDREEIISKLVIGIPATDICDWLKKKYSNVSEARFVISEKSIQVFQDRFLDMYTVIKEDIAKSKKALSTVSTEEQLQTVINKNPTYKSKLIELANKELDVRQIVANLCVAIEARVAQVFDEIQQQPQKINPRVDHLLIEYTRVLGEVLDKYYKFTEMPVSPVVQHNVTLQVVDQHISIFQEVVREVLSQMDLETSLYFMEVYNEKMAKVRMPSAIEDKGSNNTDVRLAEAKLLNETISKKINE